MKILLLTVFFVTISYFQGALAHENDGSAVLENGKTEKKEENILLGPIHFYQKYVSPAIGGSCPMYPSCSNYCVHAVKQHGPLMGWIMTCDRLMRCGRDETKRAPLVRTRHDRRYYDPVSENDFWRK
jgi:putative membrane protein insertion efficiency factor